MAGTGNDPAANSAVDAGNAQPLTDTPTHDASEAGRAAHSPVDDPRRPRLIPGLDDSPLTLEMIRDHVTSRFPDVTADLAHGELTLSVRPDQVHELLAFCRDDAQLQTRVLADLSGVHWPAGEFVIDRQPSTSGWPEYRVSRDQGVIEVLYILRSISHNHWFRVSVGVPDEAPSLPTVSDLFPTANYHEREVFDFFGVEFTGHPGLTRILMPEDWVGHPHRKDYPLGGVDIDYEHGKFIPPPERRDLREMVGGDDR